MKQLAAYALLVLALVGLSVGLYEQHKTLSATTASLKEQTARVDALRASQAKTAAAVLELSRKSQVTRQEVSDALAKEPAYRDTAVPAGVADGLCKRLRCAK